MIILAQPSQTTEKLSKRPNVLNVPASRIRVKRSNPITEGLVLAFVQDREVVNGTIGVPVASSSKLNADIGGRVIESNSITDGGYAFRDCGIQDALAGKNTVSIIARLAIDSLNTWGCFFTSPANLNTWANPYHGLGFNRDNASTGLNFSHAYSATARHSRQSKINAIKVDGIPHIYGVGKNSSGVDYYVDGVWFDDSAGFSNNMYIHHDNCYLMSRNDAATAEGVDGRTNMVLVWDRKLTDEEQIIVANDMTALFELKPKYERVYLKSNANTRTLSANVQELGDTAVATVQAIVDMAAVQTEDGDTQVATMGVIVDLTASIVDDGDTQSAELEGIPDMSANIQELGDSTVAAFEVLNGTSMTANQQEEGDTTVANFELWPEIIANQQEEGDSTAANFELPVGMTASQQEAGDTTVATFTDPGTRELVANQQEVPDIASAALQNIISITASHKEEGDSTAANFEVLTPLTEIVIPNITVIT